MHDRESIFHVAAATGSSNQPKIETLEHKLVLAAEGDDIAGEKWVRLA